MVIGSGGEGSLGWSGEVRDGVGVEPGDGQRDGGRDKGWEWINWKD